MTANRTDVVVYQPQLKAWQNTEGGCCKRLARAVSLRKVSAGGRITSATSTSEIHKRLALGKEEWDALKKERDEERSERKKARTQAYGASFVQQRKIWEDERKRNEDLRAAMRAEIDELRRKERQDEEKPGSGTPPADSEHKEPQ